MKWTLSIAALLLATNQMQPAFAQAGAGDLIKQAVAAEGGKADVGGIGEIDPVVDSDSADVEVKLVADDQAASAGRLNVAPVPGLLVLRHRAERTAIGAGPVESVPAVADAKLVDLRARCGLPAPDREHAEHDALIPVAVEVVELRRSQIERTIRRTIEIEIGAVAIQCWPAG